jgi:hypothetical protein
VLEAIDIWLQPIDPNIDTAAMSVLSLCHAIFLDLIVVPGKSGASNKSEVSNPFQR